MTFIVYAQKNCEEITGDAWFQAGVSRTAALLSTVFLYNFGYILQLHIF